MDGEHLTHEVIIDEPAAVANLANNIETYVISQGLINGTQD